MIAIGKPAPEIYDAIAPLYESSHPGMRCSMPELKDGKLLQEFNSDIIQGYLFGKPVDENKVAELLVPGSL